MRVILQINILPFLFCGIARVGTQQLGPESLRNPLKGFTAGSHPFAKPGPDTNEKLPYGNFFFVELHGLGPSRRSQEEPGRARKSQEEPSRPHSSKKA